MDFPLIQGDFETSVRTLYQSTENSVSGVWRSVRLIPNLDGTVLRFTRDLDTTYTDQTPSGEQSCAMEVEEDEIDTDDSEELRRPSAEGCEQGSLSVVYDIAYSTSYQVPVLYLHFRDPDSSVVRPDPALLERVIPTISNPQVQTVGTIGGISMTDHPISRMPVYFVHPCNTQQAMHAVCGGIRPTPFIYLAKWIGCLGTVVGLGLPVNLFSSETASSSDKRALSD